MRLEQKYRPKTLQEVLGQEKAVACVERLAERSLTSRAFWITGNSGTGKSTIARIMADSVADPLYITETVGRQLTPSKLKEIVDSWMYIPMAEKPGYALIVNEAHGLTKPVIEILLDVLERLPKNVLVVFTTTRDGNDLFEEQMDSSPFASRCICLNLGSRGLCEPFAARIKQIAELEGLDGKPINDYMNLLKRCRNNFRAALSEVEAGVML